MGKKDDLLVGLDIGTTKICCIIAEVNSEGLIEIIGIGTHPSRGLRKGVVINIESTVESIKGAVEEAELMAGVEVDSVYVGIAGGHIKGFNSHGIIAVKSKEVTQLDVNRVIEAAKAVAIPMDREVIHIIPQEFIVDGQDGIKSPLGISGVRLEAKVHIVTGAVTSAQNIVRSVNKAGLVVKDIVLEQLASSEAVLNPDERELGVAVIDIGGGTSDMAIFANDAIKHTYVLAIGGNNITNDIAIGLRTPIHEAEKIKQKYGCCFAEMIKDGEVIDIPSVSGKHPREISRQVLAEIIEPRVEEIFQLLQEEIAKNGFDKLIPSGIVLTGGSTLMEGTDQLAERIFNLPVRIGIPQQVGGLADVVSSPMYSTCVGLLLFGQKSRSKGLYHEFSDRHMFDKVFRRMKQWIEEFF